MKNLKNSGKYKITFLKFFPKQFQVGKFGSVAKCMMLDFQNFSTENSRIESILTYIVNIAHHTLFNTIGNFLGKTNNIMKDFIEILKKEFFESNDIIQEDTMFKELPEWDSLLAVSLIATIDEKYQVELTDEDIEKSMLIGDLYNVVKIKSKVL